MAFYSGTGGTAAGALITILDTELVKNANWTIYDASVGSNNKTYKCGVSGGEFYLNVADNQANYATVVLWEGWDIGAHAGIGQNSASSGAIYWRKTAGAYYVHLSDERVIYSCFGTSLNMSFWAGNCERFDASKNTPLLIGNSSSTGTGQNSLGYGGTYSYCRWTVLWLEHQQVAQACANYFDYDGGAGGNGRLYWMEKNYGWYISETLVAIPGVSRLLGIMRGVQSLGTSATAQLGIVHGDTITIGADTWDVHGSGQLCVLKRA